jgi:hypothetical protein
MRTHNISFIGRASANNHDNFSIAQKALQEGQSFITLFVQ